MKKIIGLTCMLLFCGSMVFGQLDRIMPHFGFMYEMVTRKAPGDRSPTLFPYYGLNLGGNYVLMHSNDQFSLGVDPNVNFAIFPTQGGLGLLAQTPVYLLARVGANSTPYNEQKIGLGAGIGANYTYARYDAPTLTDGFRTGYVAPAVMFELNLNLRSAVYIVRGHWNLYPVQRTINNQEYDFGNFGFGLVYGF